MIPQAARPHRIAMRRPLHLEDEAAGDKDAVEAAVKEVVAGATGVAPQPPLDEWQWHLKATPMA
jgi:hypothetical protein